MRHIILIVFRDWIPMGQRKKSYCLVLVTVVMLLIVAVCAKLSSQVAVNRIDTTRRQIKSTSDIQHDPLKTAYRRFTVDALEGYLQKYSYGSESEDIKNIRSLGSDGFSGSKRIPIQTAKNVSHQYDIEYMCKPEKSSSFSIELGRDADTYWAARVDGCNGEGVYSIAVPIDNFPEADSVVFDAADDVSFVVAIHETSTKEQK